MMQFTFQAQADLYPLEDSPEREDVQDLISLSFSFTQIASMLSVSRMTIYRRCQEYNITTNGHTPDDGELRRLIGDVRRNFPDIGERMVMGRIRAMRMRVSRERVRNILHETDPLSSALRAPRGPTSRQPYSVPGPNSLWHIGTFGYVPNKWLQLTYIWKTDCVGNSSF